MWLRYVLLLGCLSLAHFVDAQPRTVFLGFHTGIVSPYSFDQGINSDPRFRSKYDLKFAPLGVAFGVDFARHGFICTPGLVNIGQNYFVVNSTGGREGIQKTNLQYLTLPIAVKFYLIDYSFFKVSALTGASAGILLQGRQFITHDAAIYRFEEEIYPILPADYIPTVEGVQTPRITDYAMAEKNDFKSTQFFLLLGIRSDWNASEDWRVSFDMRVNFGLLNPRTDNYQQRIDAYQTLYNLPGPRHEFFGQLTVGVSRYVTYTPKAKPKKRSAQKKYPFVNRRKQGPKG